MCYSEAVGQCKETCADWSYCMDPEKAGEECDNAPDLCKSGDCNMYIWCWEDHSTDPENGTDPTNPENGTVCPMDMFECADGSMVSRTGPNCEHHCPETDPENGTDPTNPEQQGPPSECQSEEAATCGTTCESFMYCMDPTKADEACDNVPEMCTTTCESYQLITLSV